MDRLHVELRAEVEGNRLLGHAAVFNTVAKVPGHYERFERAAFDRALAGGDVRALVNHDPTLLLGRQSSGTLRLEADDDGLGFELDLPDTQIARDVRELVSRGDLDGGSVGFVAGADKWSRAADGLQVRSHTNVKRLVDVSIVTFPAYEGTTVHLRRRELETRPANLRAQLIRARARLLNKEGSK